MRVAGRGKLRLAYLTKLARPEFASLVRVVDHEDGRVSLSDFLGLIAAHRATLSPPGSGFDCLRTWQAVALGSVPLVTPDPAFDARLFAQAGAVPLPRPEELTPDSLEAILNGLVQPKDEYAAALEMKHWLRAWQQSA